MKIKNKSSHKSRNIIYLIVGVVVAILLIAGFRFFIAKDTIFGWTPIPKKVTAINYRPATPEQINAGKEIKKGSVDKTDDRTTTPPDSSSVDVQISAANQTDSTLQVRVLIGDVNTTGQCTLTLTNQANQSQVVKQTGVQALASTSTCQGFDIPLTELSAGDWSLNITYKNNTSSGADSRTLTIK